MTASDALVIGEDWISEHFFTTDATKESFQAAVLARRKEWDAQEGPTPRSAFTAARSELETALGGLLTPEGHAAVAAEEVADLYERLWGILGYGDPGRRVLARDGARLVTTPGISEGACLAVLAARPVAAVEDLLDKTARTLIEPVEVDGLAQPVVSVAHWLTYFLRDDGPDFALVLAGRWLLVTDKTRWHEGRYLAVDLQLVAERNETRRGGEIDRALACLCAQSLAPDVDGVIWWSQVLAASVKHTEGVSQELREGVRRSVEIIANEVIARRREQGRAPLEPSQGQALAAQSLRYLYRILFLLYAEASPELEVLPVGAPEYEQGYSLDRLRDLTLVTLATPRAGSGTHLFDSLAVLFRLIDRGHGDQLGPGAEPQGATGAAGLRFNALRADLFAPEAVALIDETGLGNQALQRVLRRLLLSKETRGKDRGFISYAELGINQLGSVYEGLMSYTGFFATEDLYEVAKGGDPSKGSWVVPVARSAGIADTDFVRERDEITGEDRAVRHRAGTFVYRLAGRDRQQSASYYTPEVLTRFTVEQALAELIGPQMSAREILALSVCEPALGSGAFAIEAVRQLAAAYLSRRQEELGTRIAPEDYPGELAKAKAYIALHNVYGVDLNATAVELAEITLWLDTMVAGLQAPWFGLHLRRGNSLIGARRATYAASDVSSKRWLTGVPVAAGLDSLAAGADAGTVDPQVAGRIHHFLLPSPGWGSATDAKEVRELVPYERDLLHKWRRSLQKKPTAAQVRDLTVLAYRVEELWRLALRRRQIAEDAIRRSIDVWGLADDADGPGSTGADESPVSREEIEAALADANGAYGRLRRVLDAWCALWFWPVTTGLRRVATASGELVVNPPTMRQWITGLQELLGSHSEVAPRVGKAKNERQAETFAAGLNWAELGEAERLGLAFAGARRVEDVLERHPWLQVTERIAAEQGFFHWELDFATVFARGGFDLQVGNPPWVRPDWDESSALGEFDVQFALRTKIPTAEAQSLRRETLAMPGATTYYLDALTATVATRQFVSATPAYPHLEGLRPDLYRCFMEQTWRHASTRGMIGLIHPETHFTDEKAGVLREATYRRLRRHWQFINELQLFEIDHHVSYGVHIYGSDNAEVAFIHAASLYHPEMVRSSLRHDGTGPEPGIKDEEGNWDQRPHAARVIEVDEQVLATWHAVLETKDVPVGHTRMLYTVNRSVAAVLAKLAEAPRLASLGLRFSQGWNETTDFRRGFFVKEWATPDSWDDVILQGPHIFVATPFFKSPNETMRNNLDWSSVDLEELAPEAIPITAYQRAGTSEADRYEYDCAYTDWGDEDNPDPARDHYRVAWRCMAANTGERTLIPAIIPPGAAHVDGIFSAGLPGAPANQVVAIAGFLSSLTVDFMIRSAPKAHIRASVFNRLPFAPTHPLLPALILRSLRLNCLTSAYADLWEQSYDPAFTAETWTSTEREHATQLGEVGPFWTPATPLRRAADRRAALVEIDALVALMLGVSADELCAIYRTQFPVLAGYDRRDYLYDAHGRLVPTSVRTAWRTQGDRLAVADRTVTRPGVAPLTYQLPFTFYDREADLRAAYMHFEDALARRS